MGTDGKLYGTTEFATNGNGTVFQITTNGVLTTLHAFTFTETAPESYCAPIQATNGNLYIACEGGTGLYSSGTVLRLTVPPALQSLSMSGSGGAWTLTWNGETGQTYQVQYNNSLDPAGWNNLGTPVTGTGPLLNTTDASASGNQRFYRVIAVP